LPSGAGDRYRGAAALWRRWLKEGVLLQETVPCFYVVEQTFAWGGRRHARTGVLASLDLRRSGPRTVRRHEKTLSKPKADRLRLLSALKVNTSPIFGLFTDKNGAVRAALRRVEASPAAAHGASADGSRFRLWTVKDRALQKRLSRAFLSKSLLIADGHHRFEVARAYFKKRGPAARGLLIYLCPEEDRGLLVLPTHRVVAPPEDALRRVRAECRLEAKRDLSSLLKALEKHRSPYAFGVFSGSGFFLAVPLKPGGAKSGLCVEWLAKRVTARIDPHHIAYTHAAVEAVQLARSRGGAAFLVKPASVAQIRKAVDRIGLLPQKSTYFYPKVTTGLVFNPLP